MSLQCLIRYSKDGEATVLNENGTVSKLYEDALEYAGNQNEALEIWATASLDEFSDRIGVVNKNDEASLEDVLVFMDSEIVEESPLSNLEKVQLKQVMHNLGYERLSDLSKTLNDIFKPGKVVVSSLEDIDYKALNKSKLYNATELSEIDLDEIEDLINKIDNQLLKEDVIIPKNESPATYRNSNYKTILGTYELVSEEKIDQDIRDLIEDFSSEKEFTDKIQQLPYSDFVQKFYTDKTFAKELMDKYKTLKKVSVLSIIDGKLVDTKTSTRATIANTITDEIDVIGLEVKIDYLESIDEDLWVLAEQGVRKYLKKIENDLVKEGVDVIGLASNYRSREVVIDLLKSLNTVANQAQENRLSQEALDDFSQKHDALIKKPNATSIESLPDNIKGLKIVKLYSNLSPGELYDNYGLIKVGENLYHNVNKNDDINMVYDYIYNELIADRISLPKVASKFSNKELKNLGNKPKVLEQISQYVNEVNLGFPVNDKEGYVARQIAYGHPQVSEANYPQNIKKLSTVRTNANYLKTNFVVDFYKYILEEKAKDSKTYRDILSNFQITDRDITAVRPIKSIEGIKYEQELSDYIRLMRDTNLKHLVEVENNFVPDALYYMNNLETLGEFTSERPTIDSGYVIISPNPSNYIKVGGKLYEKALSNEEADLYAEMILSKDTTYLQLEKEIKFDKEKAVKVLEGYNKKTQQKPTLSQLAEIKQKAGVETPLYKKIIEKSITMFKASLAPKTLEQKVDQIFEKNLVEFIRDKGVDVITDKQEVERVLREGGYNPIQTPAGNVLGFEKDGKIYLDEEQLNNVTTLHELVHTWQSMLEIKAAKGDKKAQEIINKREEVFSDLAEEWTDYHKGNVGVGNLQEMIIGEKAANKISDLKNRLKEAKGLVAKGAPMDIVEKNTGWFKVGEDWRYFSKNAITNLKIKTTFTPKLNSKEDITNVVDDNILFEYYPQLKNVKIEFYEGPEDILASEKEGTIRINTNRNFETLNSPAYLGGLGESIGGILPEESYEASIGHELSHIIQKIEGLPRGGSKGTAIQEARLITKEDRPQLGYLIEAIDKKLTEEGLSENETKILDYAKYVIEEGVYKGSNTPAWDVYNRIYGEVEARTLELIKNQLNAGMSIADVNFLDIQNKLLGAEGIDKNDTFEVRVTGYNFNTLSEQIGLDLSSPVYAQRASESDTEYKTRLLKEVEAYVTAPKVAEKLENLRKENPSLWQKIMDFIQNLKNWLKGEIGLSDYKGDIFSMSKEEYIDALGISVLKDDYSLNEEQQIKREAIENGTFLKAPNGKVTKLTEKQWLQVRTKNFKEWFGDWENNPENASKVVDENGEPLVMYHGSVSADIDMFDRSKSTRVSSGLREVADYFTSNIKLADFYRKGDVREDQIKKIDNQILGLRQQLGEARNLRTYEAIEQEIENLRNKKQGSVYPVFLNVKEPFREDGKGLDERAWNTFRLKLGYKTAAIKADIMDALSGNNSAARLEKNYDGAIVTNIADMFVGIDMFSTTEESNKRVQDKVKDYVGTVVATFKPNQIKSATDNIGTFSKEDDRINFNIVGQKATQQNQDLLESYNKALDLEQQGKSTAEIELETGWYKEEGDWKYFSKEILQNYKPKNITIELGKEYNLEDVIDNEELFTLYPQLRTQKTKFYNGAERDTEINTSRETEIARGFYRDGSVFFNMLWKFYEPTGNITPDIRSEALANDELLRGRIEGGIPYDLLTTIAHEIQHIQQRIEGFPVGGNLTTVFTKGKEILGVSDFTPLGVIRDKAVGMLESKNIKEEDKSILAGTIWYVNEVINQRPRPTGLYENLLGEVEARSLEYILKLNKDWSNQPYSELRKEFEKFEGILNATKYVVRERQSGNFSIQPQIPFSEKQRMARDLGTILELKPELVSLYQQEDAEEIFNKMENCGG